MSLFQAVRLAYYRMLPLQTSFPFSVAVIGAGHWGKNLIRNFRHLGVLSAVCDANPQAREALKADVGRVSWYTDWRVLLEQTSAEAVVIATPSPTHMRISTDALQAGKHVYVEKPMATTSADAGAMVALAAKQQRILMVGHLLLYHPAVNRLKQLIAEGILGDIRAVQSDRLSHNPNRPDSSVLWDLAPHDLSMICYLLDSEPEAVLSATGHRVGDDGRLDDVHVSLRFPGGCQAVIHTSWVHPVKQVQLVVHGTLGSAVLDDVLTSNKLRLFFKQPQGHVQPECLAAEPLKLECLHFLHCVQHHHTPRSDGVSGLQTVRLLEWIDACLSEQS